MQLLNYFFFILIVIYSIHLLNKRSMIVVHPYVQGEFIVITGGQAFMIFVFATGLIALSGSTGGLDLLAFRLLSLELFLVIGIAILNGNIIWNLTGSLYLLYLIWIIYGITYSEYPMFGFRVFLKYCYPFLILLFASKVVDNDDLFVKLSLLVRRIGLVSVFLTAVVPFVLILFPGVLWYVTAVAIHYIGLMVLSLAIFDIRRNKWDLIIAVVFFIPCLLWVLRTSILGSMVALTVFSLIKYKIKALPILVFVAGLLFVIVMFTPSVKKKMFNKDIDSKDLTNSMGDKISKDDINSNGRFAMWEWSLQNYYEQNKLQGSGSGTLQYVFYQRAAKGISAGIVHNDYVQILCDSGLIGLLLYLSVFLSLVVHTFFVYNNTSNSNVIRMCAIAAGASAIGMAATSYTDNTVNYTMATLSYPFGLYGMMLGLLKGQKNRQMEEALEE